MGYTDKKPKKLKAPVDFMTADKVLGWTKAREYPSIYFEGGHVTAAHGDWFNCGWEGEVGWTCLFFGNVPPDISKGAYEVKSEDDPQKRSDFLIKTKPYHKNNYAGTGGKWRDAALVEEGLESHKLVEVWERPGKSLLIHNSSGHFYHVNKNRFFHKDLTIEANVGLKLAASAHKKGKAKLNASSGSTKKRG